MRTVLIVLLAAGCTAGVEDATPTPTSAIPVLVRGDDPGTTPPVANRPAEPVRSALRSYAVVLVPSGETLPLRDAPSVDAGVVAELPGDAVEVPTTGETADVHDSLWMEVVAPDGTTGWVDSRYLTEFVSSELFCEDETSHDLVVGLRSALHTEDGEELFGLVSPTHGLRVRLLRDGPVIELDDTDMRDLMTDMEVIEWGTDPNSGLPVEGTFAKVAADVRAVLDAAPNSLCNQLLVPEATYTPALPAGWHNVNFFAFEQPPSEEGALDWATWVVGVEYVEGQPYIFSLARFGWEA